MDCFCGCGRKLSRRQTDLNLQAGQIGLELLAWDKARAAGLLGPPAADDAPRLIEQGAECFQRLLRALHGEKGVYRPEEGEDWFNRSHAERREREYMTAKGGILRPDKLLLSEEDIARLDRRRPERSFSGDAEQEEGGSADPSGRLQRLAALHAEGVLSDAEFATARARLAEGAEPPR